MGVFVDIAPSFPQHYISKYIIKIFKNKSKSTIPLMLRELFDSHQVSRELVTQQLSLAPRLHRLPLIQDQTAM
jgi:hypothetical protein